MDHALPSNPRRCPALVAPTPHGRGIGTSPQAAPSRSRSKDRASASRNPARAIGAHYAGIWSGRVCGGIQRRSIGHGQETENSAYVWRSRLRCRWPAIRTILASYARRVTGGNRLHDHVETACPPPIARPESRRQSTRPGQHWSNVRPRARPRDARRDKELKRCPSAYPNGRGVRTNSSPCELIDPSRTAHRVSEIGAHSRMPSTPRLASMLLYGTAQHSRRQMRIKQPSTRTTAPSPSARWPGARREMDNLRRHHQSGAAPASERDREQLRRTRSDGRSPSRRPSRAIRERISKGVRIAPRRRERARLAHAGSPV